MKMIKMMNEEQIIKRINQIWKELLKETSIERLGIKVIQIKQLYEVINRKELIILDLKKSEINNESIKKLIKKEVKELKDFRG